MFDRAKSNLLAARLVYGNREQDEFFLNLTRYLLQQTTEFALKHILEINAICYPNTHDIAELVGLIPASVSVDTSSILMMAGTITLWESKTRYIKNYFLEDQQIRIGFQVIETFLAAVEKACRPEKTSTSVSHMKLF